MKYELKVKVVIESKGLKLFDSTSQNEVISLLHFEYYTATIEKESILEFTDIRGFNGKWKVVDIQTIFYEKTQRESLVSTSEVDGSGPFNLIVFYEVETV